MAKKDTNVEFDEVTGNQVPNNNSDFENLQEFFEKNKNNLTIVLAALLIFIAGFMYYMNIYKPKAEMEANNSMFNAEYYFEQDSFELALNSEGGFLDVISDHGNTKAANLAHYYAGLSYYYLGDYAEAVSHLSSFSTKDAVLGSLSKGTLADAQMENGDVDAALKTYKKAANFTMNEATAPFLLKKAGIAFEMNNRNKEALELFNKLKTEFPKSELASDVDKYIGRVEAKL